MPAVALHTLHPGAVTTARLAGHAASVAQQRGIEVDIQVQHTAALPGRLPELLHNALCSIVDNAIEHGFRDREDGTLEISLYETEPAQVTLTIRDNGWGIDWARIRARCVEQGLDARSHGALARALFEPGVSSRLRMLDMLVCGLGGSLSVQSPPGSGCSVSVSFPKD